MDDATASRDLADDDMRMASAVLLAETMGHIESLRSAHGRRGWQSALAAAAGCSRATISKIVSGAHRYKPSVEMCQRLLAVTPEAMAGVRGRDRLPLDSELSVMQALANLPDDVRQRVLAYATSRWGVS